MGFRVVSALAEEEEILVDYLDMHFGKD